MRYIIRKKKVTKKTTNINVMMSIMSSNIVIVVTVISVLENTSFCFMSFKMRQISANTREIKNNTITVYVAILMAPLYFLSYILNLLFLTSNSERLNRF